MKTLVTGAGGFVGRHLAIALRDRLNAKDDLVLLDIEPAGMPDTDRHGVERVLGDLGDAAFVDNLMRRGFDCIYHLATVPGRASEVDFAAGKRVNLDGTIALLEGLRQHSPGARLIYASSVSVYGTDFPPVVDDSTPVQPVLSYAAHKAVGEILVNDYTRHGFVNGLTLRLSGIVARPPASTANATAFLNDMIHAARERRPLTIPMRPEAATWLMSLQCCVENLVHAATLDFSRLPARRNWSLPALRATMAEMIAALGRKYGDEVPGLFEFSPDKRIEAMFSQPPLEAAMARSLGFRADSNVDALFARCGVD
jgi:nucleoside-diphosphate-sugar epimerase